MDFKLFLILAVTILRGYPAQGAGIFNIVHGLLQDNVAGIPLIHEKTEWDFDPEVGKLRRVQFEALNGWQGRDLIDRLGYGIHDNGVTPKTSSVNKPAVILPPWEAATLGRQHPRP
ncbi:uncharacterized protein LOC110117398 [Athalia rosae]|uniref:uncharacterized protein LOC110117398 n=1 Tax=Athalia rosae TaxID=37344 RepID=UPI0020339AD4|nr:uncharacterized protein LOC110117398 [Athalia rosae]